MRSGWGQEERYPHRIEFIKNLHQVLLQLESDLFTLEKRGGKKIPSSFRKDNTEGLGLGQTHIKSNEKRLRLRI